MRCRTIPGLLAAALQAIERRRAKLLADRQQVASLGFPLRQRGSPQTYCVRLRQRGSPQTYAVPTVCPKARIQRPSGGTAPFAGAARLSVGRFRFLRFTSPRCGEVGDEAPGGEVPFRPSRSEAASDRTAAFRRQPPTDNMASRAYTLRAHMRERGSSSNSRPQTVPVTGPLSTARCRRLEVTVSG